MLPGVDVASRYKFAIAFRTKKATEVAFVFDVLKYPKLFQMDLNLISM